MKDIYTVVGDLPTSPPLPTSPLELPYRFSYMKDIYTVVGDLPTSPPLPTSPLELVQI
jgi:hypothetical protein